MIVWILVGLGIDNLSMGLFESLMSEGFEFNTQPDLDFARMKTPETAKYNRRGFSTVKLGQGINERVVELKLRGKI
jgi:hypothetical protein